MSVLCGFETSLCENTGTDETPIWSEIELAGDIQVPDTYSEAVANHKGSSFVVTLPGLRSFAVTGEMIYDNSDLRVLSIDSKYSSRSEIELLLLYGKPGVSGSKGIRFSARNFDNTASHVVGDVVKKSFNFKNAGMTSEPSAYTIAGGG